MKERPIIMNAESVRAILKGRKTQTRRVIKPQPLWIGEPNTPFKTTDANPKGIIKCPYGHRDDRLWVKETLWLNGGYVATDPPNFENEAKKPSIYCSKFWSRITLDVLNVRVEKLNVIDNEGALAEGVDPAGYGETVLLLGLSAIPAMSKPIFDFAILWNKINKKRGFGWHRNPWVWVVEFETLLWNRVVEDGRDERVERSNHSRAGPVSNG